MGITRRRFLAVIAAASPLSLAACARGDETAAVAARSSFEVTRTEAEWRSALTPVQFAVLREHDTEAPYSSLLNEEHRDGIYRCAGCGLALFSSSTKFESGTGWPSFYAPLEDAIGTTVDRRLFIARTEVHCRRCGGHLGHVFDDGPPPTGKRYCLNGAALTFDPEGAPS